MKDIEEDQIDDDQGKRNRDYEPSTSPCFFRMGLLHKGSVHIDETDQIKQMHTFISKRENAKLCFLV